MNLFVPLFSWSHQKVYICEKWFLICCLNTLPVLESFRVFRITLLKFGSEVLRDWINITHYVIFIQSQLTLTGNYFDVWLKTNLVKYTDQLIFEESNLESCSVSIFLFLTRSLQRWMIVLLCGSRKGWNLSSHLKLIRVWLQDILQLIFNRSWWTTFWFDLIFYCFSSHYYTNFSVYIKRLIFITMIYRGLQNAKCYLMSPL